MGKGSPGTSTACEEHPPPGRIAKEEAGAEPSSSTAAPEPEPGSTGVPNQGQGPGPSLIIPPIGWGMVHAEGDPGPTQTSLTVAQKQEEGAAL